MALTEPLANDPVNCLVAAMPVENQKAVVAVAEGRLRGLHDRSRESLVTERQTAKEPQVMVTAPDRLCRQDQQMIAE
jgi:hypothetical protein